ncbi:MAG: recombination protein NinG [Candidatus Paceibacterota bacterium]
MITKITLKEKAKLVKLLQEKIWIECRRIIRARYPHDCYTCGAKDLVGANLHTGHFIAKKAVKNYLKYDLRILRPQCYFCNMKCGGQGALYYRNMVAREGQEYVDLIFADLDKKIAPKDLYEFYTDLYNKYVAMS